MIPDLAQLGHSDRIKLFAWFLHGESKQERFQGAHIARCYDALHLPKPTSFGPYLVPLEKKKEVLRDTKGLYLSRSVRDVLSGKYGERAITVQIAKMLETLPNELPDLAEKTFLVETLRCLKVGAYRASIVMAWNLAYHHLCDYILKSPDRLSDFNTQWPSVYPGHHKKESKIIVSMDDFGQELKESHVIEICVSAALITKDQRKILTEKLGTRNTAAHPSSVKIEQLQAEEFIDSLIKNVVLKLA